MSRDNINHISYTDASRREDGRGFSEYYTSFFFYFIFTDIYFIQMLSRYFLIYFFLLVFALYCYDEWLFCLFRSFHRKTGWATVSTSSTARTTTEFPADAADRIEKANVAMQVSR